jgi:hypothetical protein
MDLNYTSVAVDNKVDNIFFAINSSPDHKKADNRCVENETTSPPACRTMVRTYLTSCFSIVTSLLFISTSDENEAFSRG